MQKIVIIALVFLGLGVSAVFGSVTKQETMSETEMQYLFGNSSDDAVSLLSTEEMKETEGEWGWTGAALGIVVYTAFNVAQGKPITAQGVIVAGLAGAAGEYVGAAYGGSMIPSAGSSGTITGTAMGFATEQFVNNVGGNKSPITTPETQKWEEKISNYFKFRKRKSAVKTGSRS